LSLVSRYTRWASKEVFVAVTWQVVEAPTRTFSLPQCWVRLTEPSALMNATGMC
jgi:hypothetical protein